MLVQQRSTKTKVLAILFIIIGVIILISSLISILQMSSFYLEDIYSSIFTYLLGIIFGRLGWGIHFGLTLLLIGINFLKPLNSSRKSVEETHSLSDTVIENKRKYMSVIEWFGTLVLIAIPIVNVIMLLVWAFGSDNEKKNFSLATLLYTLVATIIAVTVMLTTSQMF